MGRSGDWKNWPSRVKTKAGSLKSRPPRYWLKRNELDRASLLHGWNALNKRPQRIGVLMIFQRLTWRRLPGCVIEDEIDTAEVSAALRAALEGNAALERAKQYRALQAEHTAAWAAHTEINERMKARAAARAAAMQAAEMPIAGLAIGDGEVFYRGVPFNQASGAEQIRVSLAIGMERSSKMKYPALYGWRVMRISTKRARRWCGPRWRSTSTSYGPSMWARRRG